MTLNEIKKLENEIARLQKQIDKRLAENKVFYEKRNELIKQKKELERKAHPVATKKLLFTEDIVNSFIKDLYLFYFLGGNKPRADIFPWLVENHGYQGTVVTTAENKVRELVRLIKRGKISLVDLGNVGKLFNKELSDTLLDFYEKLYEEFNREDNYWGYPFKLSFVFCKSEKEYLDKLNSLTKVHIRGGFSKPIPVLRGELFVDSAMLSLLHIFLSAESYSGKYELNQEHVYKIKFGIGFAKGYLDLHRDLISWLEKES